MDVEADGRLPLREVLEGEHRGHAGVRIVLDHPALRIEHAARHEGRGVALAATSSYLYSTESQPERTQRWLSRLRMSLIWPIARASPNPR